MVEGNMVMDERKALMRERKVVVMMLDNWKFVVVVIVDAEGEGDGGH